MSDRFRAESVLRGSSENVRPIGYHKWLVCQVSENGTNGLVSTLVPWDQLHCLSQYQTCRLSQDKSSSGSSSTLKIEALCFLKLTLATSDTAVYEPHLAVLCPPIFAAVGERYYKV